jgi:hypothetical protein
MLELERRVHTCTRCRQGRLRNTLSYPPVYSFGNAEGKYLFVVGQNPSGREYINGYLSTSPDIEERRRSQLSYFDRRKYAFFNEPEKFFNGKAKETLDWKNSPWEKVGYLDLVKCPTRLRGRGQWSHIPSRMQQILIKNCEEYLKQQFDLYNPKVIIAYGADVGRWFSEWLNVPYEEFENVKAQLNDTEVNLVFVPQRQGPHSKPEASWVQNRIAKVLT